MAGTREGGARLAHGWGFDSLIDHHFALLAQFAEQPLRKRQVVGSSPTQGSTFRLAGSTAQQRFCKAPPLGSSPGRASTLRATNVQRSQHACAPHRTWGFNFPVALHFGPVVKWQYTAPLKRAAQACGFDSHRGHHRGMDESETGRSERLKSVCPWGFNSPCRDHFGKVTESGLWCSSRKRVAMKSRPWVQIPPFPRRDGRVRLIALSLNLRTASHPSRVRIAFPPPPW